ncbi:hypothetical protein BJY04DRAFT_194475 [Aspergillus karnatakaensis]|uniref:uncharacterized protein n=1 Tax=Aspergillus karnatakaensis TaxID=1810916 RepID=UPI003CCDF95E
MAKHNVVATCLPSGEIDTNSAASAISHLVRSFPASDSVHLLDWRRSPVKKA